MTTQKHLRDEEIVDAVEPPRKKSKKLDSNGERIKAKKSQKNKQDKVANGTQNGDVSEEVSKKDKKKKKNKSKKKKKNKSKKSKALDEEAVDVAASAEETATPEDAAEAADQVTEAPKEKKKKSKKDKKSKKSKDASIEEEKVDEEMTDAPAVTTETEPTTETTTPEAADVTEEAPKEKKSKKDKKKSKKDKKSKTSPAESNGAKANGNASTSYVETDAVKSLSDSDVSAFFAKHNITVSNPDSHPTYRPVTSFAQLPTTTLVSKSPFAAYKEPTPIQAASWPYGLAGRDIVGVAETGSGKTMAFAIPCVEAVLAAAAADTKSRGGGKATRALVVSPTRELAMQTHEQVSKLCSLVGLSSVCIYGGASKDDQRRALRRDASVVVATPGRLMDFISDGDIELSHASFVVLDEADRMLDKGFEQAIQDILSSCPPTKSGRQTLMFTATWPLSVQALASTFMSSPVKITIGRGNNGDSPESSEVKLQANERIKQEVEVIDQRAKEQRVLQLIKKYQAGSKRDDRILVFCLYKKEAMRVETFLSQRDVRVCSIHGDLRQDQRTRSLEAFKQGTTPVMVATDVAARGLDIPEVKLVINVTFPLTIEDYVHRIGRTGRAGKDGHAISFFTEHDKPHSGELINVLRGAKQPVPDELLKFGTTVKKKGHDAYGAFYKNVDTTKKATKITFD